MTKTKINPQTQPEYLNPDEVAKKLRVNLNTVYLLCRRPDFPAVRISPRRIVVPADALHEWMIANLGA